MLRKPRTLRLGLVCYNGGLAERGQCDGKRLERLLFQLRRGKIRTRETDLHLVADFCGIRLDGGNVCFRGTLAPRGLRKFIGIEFNLMNVRKNGNFVYRCRQ